MKNLSLILNVVLAIAVIILYILHFSGSKGPAGADSTTATGSTNMSGGVPLVAYVNSDTLLKYYDFFKDKSAELDEKQKKLEAEFQNRAKGLENEVANFQRTANNMTISQARAIEEDLMKKRQNLMQYQQNLAGELQQAQAEVSDELYENVSKYLEDRGKKNEYNLVLTYTKNSGVLYADDSLDITQQVIKELNEVYKNKGKSTTAPADSTVSK